MFEYSFRLIFDLLLIRNIDVAQTSPLSHSPHGIRRASTGTVDATGIRIVIRSDSNTKSDVSRKTLVTQIAVEYYLDIDEKKAIYFQKKLNGLVVKSLDAPSV